MSGSIMQLASIGSVDQYIPNQHDRHVFENMYLDLNNGNPIGNSIISTEIIRHADLFLPKKICCYNPDTNFAITKIEIKIGGNVITNLDDLDFINNLNPDFIENLEIDENETYKIYNLDKTKCFYKLYLIAVQYQRVEFVIYTIGNCEKIQLNADYIYLDTEARRETAQSRHEIKTRHLNVMNIQNYDSNENLQLHIGGNTNGLIISNINVDKLNSINLNLNGQTRINYVNKIQIRLSTQRLNDNTIYLNFNNANYNALPNNSSLNLSVIDNKQLKLVFDDGFTTGLNFKIGYYYLNVLKIQNGMGGLAFIFENEVKMKKSDTTWINETIPFIPFDTTECPVTYETIKDKYIQCSSCKNNFSYKVKEMWLSSNSTCPLCRVKWSNFVIYTL